LKRTALLLISTSCLISTGCQRAPKDAPPGTSYRTEAFQFKIDGAAPESIHGASVTRDFVTAVKTPPLLGRMFLADEHHPPTGPVAILSYRFWERRLGGDATIIGRNIQLNDKPFTIVGIMPTAFDIPPDTDVWIERAESSN